MNCRFYSETAIMDEILMEYDDCMTLDERIAAWKYLLPLDEKSEILLIGDPHWGLVRGLARSVKRVLIAPYSDTYEKDITYLTAKEDDLDIQVLRWLVDDKFPLSDNSMQAIAIMNKKFSTATTLKECNRILTPGGAIIAHSSKLKAFQPNKPNNPTNSSNSTDPITQVTQQTKIYAIVPGFANPRWIIPLKSGPVSASSLKLYNPGKLYAKVRKRTLFALSRIGLGGLLMQNRLVIIKKLAGHDSDKTSGLHDLLKEVLGRKDIEITLSTGTPGYYRKVTAQVMAPDGRILAYAKIADTDQAKKLVEQEAKILSRLEGLHMLWGDTPRVLHFGPWGHETILVQSNVRKGHSRRPKQLDEGLITFLSELLNKTAATKTLRDSACFVQFENNINKLKGRITKDWEYRIARSLEIIQKNFADQKIPLGICHGDFTPFNIYIRHGSISVFDWEYAKEESIPFWDLFHFIIQANALRKKAQSSRLKAQTSYLINSINPIIQLTKSTRTLSGLISMYARSLNLNLNINLSLLLLFYLADVSSFYLDISINYGSISNKNSALLDVWAEMMDGIFNEL